MLTLRIQQTCHRSGAVILFSSLDPAFSAARIVAEVARCMADREERVLVVDALSIDHSTMPAVNLLGIEERGDTPGLAEYLAGGDHSMTSLIQPTSCPGVDAIASGNVPFDREAMASSALTELLKSCRQSYTMVLVHGPVAVWAADLQMLTARADGVVLAASRAASCDPRAREVVEDLLNLGAPIIGVVV
jgi:Mrp family chromosome partitioning ATPase